MIEQFATDILITKLIAKGGMGEVFLGTMKGAAGFERKVAVKRIFKHLANKKNFRAMFEREVNLSSKLQHPNIIQIIRAEENKYGLYYVMEYVHGKHVAQLIEKAISTNREIPLAMACYIILQSAKGLAYAHSLLDDETGQPLKLVHRDISPANIMMGYNGAIKIVDFGIAKAENSSDLTKVGVLKGKFKYLAPERIISNACDNRSDLFSLGVVFYELLAREHLFHGESSADILEKISKFTKPMEELLHLDAPDGISEILKKLLAHDPQHRYQSAEELESDLIIELNQLYPGYSDKNFREMLKDFFPEEVFALNEVSESQNMIAPDHNQKKINQIDMIYSRAKAVFTSLNLEAVEFKKFKRPLLVSIASLVVIGTIGISYQLNIFSNLYAKMFGIPDSAKIAATDFKHNKNNKLLAWFAAENLNNFSQTAEWSSDNNEKLRLVQKQKERIPAVISVYDQPQYLSFDGQNDRLQSSFTISADALKNGITIFMVTELPKANDNAVELFNLISRKNSKNFFKISVFKNSLHSEVACGVSKCFWSAERSLSSGKSLFTIRLSPKHVELFQNQKSVLLQSIRDNQLGNSAISMSIGNLESRVTNHSEGFKVHEIAVYKSALTPAEIAEIQNYLGVKYQLPRAIPRKFI